MTKQRHLDQVKIFEEAQDHLKNQFQQLSEQALQRNTTQLLQLSKQQHEKHALQGDAALQQRQSAIQEMLNPVKDLLQRLENAAKQSGEKQAATHGKLAEQVHQLANLQVKVQQETQSLVDALKRPETRGRWGEITLKRVLEEAGMMENCVFSEQSSMMEDGGAVLRPDVVLSLPQGRNVAIDSKTPLDAYIALIDQQDNQGEINRHVRHIKTHMKQLASKAILEQFERLARICRDVCAGGKRFCVGGQTGSDNFGRRVAQQGCDSNAFNADGNDYGRFLDMEREGDSGRFGEFERDGQSVV